MLKLVPNHFKTKKDVQTCSKTLLSLIRYVPYWYKMYHKAILETGEMLKPISDHCRNKKCVVKMLIIMLMH